MKFVFILCFTILTTSIGAIVSLPILTAWQNSTGLGYKNIPFGVTAIRADSTYAYITTNSIPSYSIGTWPNNPNTPAAKNITFKFPLNPSYSKNGLKSSIGAGASGLWINGVQLYQFGDGITVNKIWHRNAKYWEGSSFDSCNGHAGMLMVVF